MKKFLIAIGFVVAATVAVVSSLSAAPEARACEVIGC